MAASDGANELIAKAIAGRNGVLRQMHQPRPHIGFEVQRKVAGEYLFISSPGSLDGDGVDAQKLYRVEPPIILLRYLWLERIDG